jgi:hypothetical protein
VVRRIAHELVDVERYPSHGAVISAGEAARLGLSVTLLAADDELWRALWSLVCELTVALDSSDDRLFESRDVSLMLSERSG